MLAVVLIINKSFMRTFPVHNNKFTNRFNWLAITNKIRNKLIIEITNDRINCIRQTDVVTLNLLTSCLILLTSWTLQTLVEMTGLLTVNGLTMINTTDLKDITSICIIVTSSFTNIQWFNESTNTTDVTNITFSCITGTGRFT